MDADVSIKRGNRLPSLVVIARDKIGPVDLSGFAATFKMVNVLTAAVEIADAAATIATDPTFTADASTDTLNSAGHTVTEGQDATLRSSGTLPGGLVVNRQYFAVNVVAGVSLQLALTEGGAPVAIENAGTGTHTLTLGKITYDWLDVDTDTPGTYQAQFDTIKDGKRQTYPNDRHLTIEILSDLTDASDRTKAIKAVMDRVQPDAQPTLTQGEIELEVDRAQLAKVWQPDTVYKFNDVVVPVERNGLAYVCVQPGTSKSGSYGFYDWPGASGVYFGDGGGNPGLVWEVAGHDRFNGAIFGCENNIYDINRACRECWLKKARYCSDMLDDADINFSEIRKNCLAHAGEFRPFKRQAVLVRV